MKTRITILLITLLNMAINLNAQETKSYHEKMKIMMSELDTTNFKNNILYEKVYPLARLRNFNQNGVKDTSNYKHFFQSVHELHLASNKKSMIAPEFLEQLVFNAQDENQVLVGILNMDFTTIKIDAIDGVDDKMAIDSTGTIKKYIEIPDKNPYLHKQALVISPLQKNAKQIDNNITFSFSDAFLELSENPIKNLKVDFGDGQIHEILNNNNFINKILSYSFNDDGVKLLKFIGVYQNNSTFETYAKLLVTILTTDGPAIHKLRAVELFTPYVPDSPYIPADATFSEVNEHTEIEYAIYYSTSPARSHLEKPIIITDGIDYGGADEREIHDLYHDKLKLTDTGEKLGYKLRQEGYDVIIANYPKYKIGEYHQTIDPIGDPHPGGWRNPMRPPPPDEPIEIIRKYYRKGGADYIQRNAQAVKELIRTVNDSLVVNGSSEKLVVVGPSMGGLVTRWALKEMENDGEDHNTRLWVSFDSPHQGANISIGLQYGARYQNNYVSLDKLKRKASRQMLVYHHFDQSGNIVDGGAPGFRNRFKNELASLSYPNPTNDPDGLRKIALVNGSSTGELNNSTNQCFVHTDILLIGSGAFYNMNFFYPSHIRFTKNSGLQTVFELDHPSTLNNWPFNKDDIFKKVYNDSSIGSYDNAPGSKFVFDDDDLLNSNSTTYEGVWIAGFYVTTVTQQPIDNFSFMPTKSSLDFQGSNKLLREEICYNLVESGEIPFDSYYASDQNEKHVELNQNNVNWLIDELILTTPPSPQTYCDAPIASLDIIGADILCPDDPFGIYFLEPNDLTDVTWTTTGLTVISSDNQKIRVKMNEPTHGPAFGEITATVGDVSISRPVICLHIPPSYDIAFNEDSNIMLSLQDNANELPLEHQNITDVQWELTTGDCSILDADLNSLKLYGNNFTGKVTVTNDVGSTTQNIFWPDPDKCYAITKVGQDKYQVIDRCNDNEVVESLPIKELYDIYGNKISDIPIDSQDLDINNIGQSGTINIIRINVNSENITKRIIKD